MEIEILNDVETGKVASLVQSYRAGEVLTAPVVVTYAGRALALSGSHRLTALLALVETGEIDQDEYDERIAYVDGDAIASKAKDVVEALDVLGRICATRAPQFFELLEVMRTLEPYLSADVLTELRDQCF